jgi:hypothetical protein
MALKYKSRDGVYQGEAEGALEVSLKRFVDVTYSRSTRAPRGDFAKGAAQDPGRVGDQPMILVIRARRHRETRDVEVIFTGCESRCQLTRGRHVAPRTILPTWLSHRCPFSRLRKVVCLMEL